MESILLSVTYLLLGSLSGPVRDHHGERERGERGSSEEKQNHSGWERKEKKRLTLRWIPVLFALYIPSEEVNADNCISISAFSSQFFLILMRIKPLTVIKQVILLKMHDYTHSCKYMHGIFVGNSPFVSYYAVQTACSQTTSVLRLLWAIFKNKCVLKSIWYCNNGRCHYLEYGFCSCNRYRNFELLHVDLWAFYSHWWHESPLF